MTPPSPDSSCINPVLTLLLILRASHFFFSPNKHPSHFAFFAGVFEDICLLFFSPQVVENARGGGVKPYRKERRSPSTSAEETTCDTSYSHLEDHTQMGRRSGERNAHSFHWLGCSHLCQQDLDLSLRSFG